MREEVDLRKASILDSAQDLTNGNNASPQDLELKQTLLCALVASVNLGILFLFGVCVCVYNVMFFTSPTSLWQVQPPAHTKKKALTCQGQGSRDGCRGCLWLNGHGVGGRPCVDYREGVCSRQRGREDKERESPV